jgi:predicted acylesterase/phospholipase RssA
MPTIKHLVLSGGGAAGLMLYGAAKQLATKQFWQADQLQSIYGCSIGAFLAVVLALNIEWTWLDDYFIQRPWDKLVTQSARTLLDCFAGRGLLGEEIIAEAIKPLLATKELPLQVTLAELYSSTGIDLHLFTVDINQVAMRSVDLSHATHPTLPVVKALAMSMAFPLVFRPVLYEAGCYVDGGFLTNYPLTECLQNTAANPNEVLGLEVTCHNPTVQAVTADSHLLDVMMSTVRSMVTKLAPTVNHSAIKYHLPCATPNWSDLSRWWDVMQKSELRHELITQGEVYANIFYTAHTQHG